MSTNCECYKKLRLVAVVATTATKTLAAIIAVAVIMLATIQG